LSDHSFSVLASSFACTLAHSRPLWRFMFFSKRAFNALSSSSCCSGDNAFFLLLMLFITFSSSAHSSAASKFGTSMTNPRRNFFVAAYGRHAPDVFRFVPIPFAVCGDSRPAPAIVVTYYGPYRRGMGVSRASHLYSCRISWSSCGISALPEAPLVMITAPYPLVRCATSSHRNP
jgi:hypothetical protein